MQRIDEDIYIDDTLVTCAEYQLFVDETREQRKYYQPDHWTSYQFPTGQAREPILGLRHADAVTFCKWLTNRRGDEWKLRLPSQREATELQLSHINRITVGYWLNDQFQFAWVGPTPDNARRVSLLQIELNLDRDVNTINSRVFPSTFNRDQELTHVFDFVNDRRLNANRFIELKRIRALVLNLPRIIDLNVTRDLTRVFNMSCNRGIDLTRMLGTLSDKPSLAQSQDSLLELYIDLITLEERIAGHSPAFEGIRLVKERTR